MRASDGSIRGQLAANLRRARGAKELSISELSRLSGIGKATLSQLESGTGNPTIETVFSLSRALRLPISDLLDATAPEPTVVRGAEVEVLRGAGVDLRPLSRLETGDSIVEVYDQRVRAGGRQGSAGHVGVEHTTVQAGTLLVHLGGQTTRLGPGDYIRFAATVPHRYEAPEDEVRSVLLLQYRADHAGGPVTVH